MTVFHQVKTFRAMVDQCEVIQYLLNGAWDIDNSNHAQTLLWGARRTSACNCAQYLEARSVISRRLLELGQSFGSEFYTEPNSFLYWLNMLDLENMSKLLRFLISHGMDLECRAPHSEETPLLHMARSSIRASVTSLRVFLEHGADYTATDYFKRGPLHLVLRGYDNPWKLSYDKKRWSRRSHLCIEKLVLLLRAGCSVNAVDDGGETPHDYARKIRADDIWMSALQEVGMSDGEVVDSSLGQASNPNLLLAPPSPMPTFDYSRQHRANTC